MRSLQRHRTMIALAAAALTLCISCTDRDPTASAAGGARMDALPAGAPVYEGCTTLDVRLSGRDDATARADTSEACGPIRPVVVGEPIYDRAHGSLRLPIALRNDGNQKVKAPARLYAWEDSALVTDPPGLAQNRHEGGYVQLVGADSLIAADAAEHTGAQVWKYDSTLATADSPQTLALGQTSRVRWVELYVKDGVHGFRLVLHAAARRASPPVPLVPPETEPGWFADSTRYTGNTTCLAGIPALPDVIELLFQFETPQPERQAAVDLVDGEVIGGHRTFIEDGYYYIRVPEASFCNALSQLRNLPQVESAEDMIIPPVGVPYYLHPNDGPGWGDWALNTASIAYRTWALDHIAAPYAWGCTTGSAAVTLGVVDEGFRVDFADVMENAPNSLAIPQIQRDTTWHGTVVAAIVGARGNNGTGMTGTMWQADLRLHDYNADVRGRPVPDTLIERTVIDAIYAAGHEGAVAINLSRGIGWQRWKGRRPGTVPAELAADRRTVRWFRGQTLRVLRRLAAEGKYPLLVVSAGNDSIDAWWNGYPAAADSSNQVIVVGASTPHNAFADWSSRGARISITAPGDSVPSMNGASPTSRLYRGTSVAAPFVTGTIGLLVAFDPTLANRPAELRRLLLEGARRGGHATDGPDGTHAYLLNAYESLRLAAQRRGGPICGNRVWTDGDRILVQRDTTPGAWPDTLYPSFLPTAVDVMHGGRRIRVRDLAGGERDFTYSNGQWVRGPWNGSVHFDTFVPGSGASYLSAGDVYGFKSPRTHDGDTTYTLLTSGDPSNVTLSRYTGGTLEALGNPFEGSDHRSAEHVCIWAAYSANQPDDPDYCYILTDSVATYDRGDWTLGVIPGRNDSLAPGAKLLMANRRTRISHTFSGWSEAGCPKYPRTITDASRTRTDSVRAVCRGWTTQMTSTGTRFTVLDRDGNELADWTEGGEIDLRAISEDGRRAMVKKWLVSSTFETHMVAPFLARARQAGYTATCAVEERRLTDHQVLWTGPNCLNSGVDPGFSPNRLPEIHTTVPAGISRDPAPRSASSRPAWSFVPTSLLFLWA
jgi:hypothetical protein